MDLNKTIDIILRDLKDLDDIIDDLKTYREVPAFQIELARSKCKGAAEVLSLLRQTETAKSEVTDSSAGKSEPDKTAGDGKSKASMKQVRTIPAEPPIKQPDITPEKQPSVRSATGATILADQYTRMSDSFNEKLGGKKHDSDISGMINTRPLQSLTDAIGINDRFVFINEVFNGSREAYDQAIIKLDKVKDLPEARDIIMSYTGAGEDNETIRQLLDLVKRKISYNE